MFCKDCGTKLADDSRFCSKCGCAQPETPPVQPITNPTDPSQTFADKVRATAKKAGSSTGFLIATICFTLVQVLNLASLGSVSNVLNAFGDLFAEFGPYGREILTTLEDVSLVASILSMIPGLLMAAALWNIYGNCSGRKARVGTGGLTTIFVIHLVQMVLSSLVLLGSVVLLVLAYFSAESLFSADAKTMEIVILTIGAILLAIFAFMLIYYIHICATVSNVRSTLKTGVPNKKVSRFVAVLCYISGAMMIFSGVENLLSGAMASLGSLYATSVYYPLSTVLFLSGASSLLTAVMYILFGSLLFSYRSKMKTLEAEERITAFQTLSYAEPYTSPVYIPPEPTNGELEETKKWDC